MRFSLAIVIALVSTPFVIARPLPGGDDRIIKPGREERTSSGLMIPDTQIEKPPKETVPESPGRLDSGGPKKPINVKVGDKVKYGAR
ncbi:hypothetical protein AX14_010805 [Amanita brunnescens Koide BX004]|nr:hypothetical protein AX14_010805 [Amanita brunnescens Koide BX004]